MRTAHASRMNYLQFCRSSTVNRSSNTWPPLPAAALLLLPDMSRPAKILIVEDNPLNMELASDLLASAGFEVLQATTAERGIQLARSLVPELILMDTSLPGMDGLRAT